MSFKRFFQFIVQLTVTSLSIASPMEKSNKNQFISLKFRILSHYYGQNNIINVKKHILSREKNPYILSIIHNLTSIFNMSCYFQKSFKYVLIKIILQKKWFLKKRLSYRPYHSLSTNEIHPLFTSKVSTYFDQSNIDLKRLILSFNH